MIALFFMFLGFALFGYVRGMRNGKVVSQIALDEEYARGLQRGREERRVQAESAFRVGLTLGASLPQNMARSRQPVFPPGVVIKPVNILHESPFSLAESQPAEVES